MVSRCMQDEELDTEPLCSAQFVMPFQVHNRSQFFSGMKEYIVSLEQVKAHNLWRIFAKINSMKEWI